MMTFMRNRRGFTLVEIVTTTAIIGSLAAIAVPNFLRVKMNVNMEMVKQHMKVIGQEMNELYNQSNPHEFPADIMGLDGNPEEELSITASLNAIDDMGYTMNEEDYETDAAQSTYTYTTCVKPGLENIAGPEGHCFEVGTMGVQEILLVPWDGTGMAMVNLGAVGPPIDWAFNMFNELLADGDLNDSETRILSGFFESWGMWAVLNGTERFPQQLQEGAIPSYGFWFNSQDVSAVRNTFGELFGELSRSGIKAYLDPNERPQSGLWEGLSSVKIGFEMDDPPSSREEVLARMAASENYQAYLAYKYG